MRKRQNAEFCLLGGFFIYIIYMNIEIVDFILIMLNESRHLFC